MNLSRFGYPFAGAAELGNVLNYLDPSQSAQFWDKVDARFKPLIEAAAKGGR